MMTITTEQIRNIQGGLGAQAPSWDRSEDGVPPTAGASNVAITTPNGAPTTAQQGSPLIVSTGDSGIYTAIALKTVALTTADIRWWFYYDGAASGIAGVTGWYAPEAGEFTIVRNWTQLLPTGPATRIYCEVVSITGTSVTPYIGPSDLGGL